MVRPLGESGCLSSTRIILHETFPFLLYRKYGLYATSQFLIYPILIVQQSTCLESGSNLEYS